MPRFIPFQGEKSARNRGFAIGSIVDIYRSHAGIRPRAGHEEIANEQGHDGERAPAYEAAAIITCFPHEIGDQEWQPAVKEREPAQEQGRAGIEHIIGHACQGYGYKISEKIQDPDGLRGENANGAHGEQKSAFSPHPNQGENQSHIAEVEKVRASCLKKESSGIPLLAGT